jgi:cytochrome c2
MTARLEAAYNRAMRALLSVLILLAAGPAAAADGKALYDEQCAACHALEATSTPTGPSLKGVVFRKVAVLPDFAYTPALKQRFGTWTPERLDSYLKDSQAFAPGNGMTFAMEDAAERRAIIDYLKSAK